VNARISNPLTVVAIFSGLAEAFATVALINVPHDIQQVFVFFVMAFPTLIVLLFFAVLNWNHTVLYAPGDFEDEAMYLESIRLRGSLKYEIMETLASPGTDGAGLTPEQIQVVSEKVDRVIGEASQSPRKQQILGLLNEGPANLRSISENLNLNPSYAIRLLGALLNEGKVVRGGTGRAVQWSLAPNHASDA